MIPLPHRYELTLAGPPTGYGELTTGALPPLRTAPPLEYDGPGDAWSPEHLLLAAVEACFLFTLRAVAGASKIEFTALDLQAVGTVDRSEGRVRFVEIVLRPRLTVPAGTDRDRALRVLEKAKQACLVTASLSTAVRMDPEVIGA